MFRRMKWKIVAVLLCTLFIIGCSNTSMSIEQQNDDVYVMMKGTDLYIKYPKKDAEKVLKAFTEVVAEELKKGEKIQLVGFGTFEVRQRSARNGVNPRTKQSIKIPASKAPVFKAGKALKESCN